MYPPPSARFLPALSESHVPVSVVELHRPDGRVEEVVHTGGSVTVDRSSAARRTATVESPAIELLPWTAADYLAVSGARLRILRGVAHPDGVVETVPIFYGRLDSITGDPEEGSVTLSASGLEAVVADDKFLAPYSTRNATAAITSITALIRSSLPDAVITATAPDDPLGPVTWDTEGDRWSAVQEIATAVGADVYADADGIFHVAPLPDVLEAPVVWEVAAGPGGALVGAARGWSRDGMYNVVIATGENTETDTAPVSAVMQDEDPTSPTYYAGPFGRVPRFYSSSTLTTVGAAESAARKLLLDSVKPGMTADISSLPNPLLEPGDVIRVVHSSGKRDLYQVQSFSIDLSLGGDFTLQMIGGKEDS
ncbi:DUF5047 domain-containing protein [Streptomyces cacaoi]|uniref:DUF5047 domain-containing protein n=1 Tax=Streptomyces cacaoi TaxID=1898 RepID=UPI0037481D43